MNVFKYLLYYIFGQYKIVTNFLKLLPTTKQKTMESVSKNTFNSKIVVT